MPGVYTQPKLAPPDVAGKEITQLPDPETYQPKLIFIEGQVAQLCVLQLCDAEPVQEPEQLVDVDGLVPVQ